MIVKDEAPIDKLQAVLLVLWEEISRHFLTCDVSRCMYGYRPAISEDGEYTVSLTDEEGNQADAIMYYCPSCGRRIRMP